MDVDAGRLCVSAQVLQRGRETCCGADGCQGVFSVYKRHALDRLRCLERIFGIWQWVVVGLIVVLLFARPGKISGLMGDFGKGLSNFKKGMKDEGNEKQNIEEDVSDNTDKNKS